MTRRVWRNRSLASLAAFAFLLLLIHPLVTAQEQPSQAAPTQPEKPKQLIVPEADKNRKNPVAATPASVESGKNLYDSQCAMCHGANQ